MRNVVQRQNRHLARFARRFNQASSPAHPLRGRIGKPGSGRSIRNPRDERSLLGPPAQAELPNLLRRSPIRIDIKRRQRAALARRAPASRSRRGRPNRRLPATGLPSPVPIESDQPHTSSNHRSNHQSDQQRSPPPRLAGAFLPPTRRGLPPRSAVARTSPAPGGVLASALPARNGPFPKPFIRPDLLPFWLACAFSALPIGRALVLDALTLRHVLVLVTRVLVTCVFLLDAVAVKRAHRPGRKLRFARAASSQAPVTVRSPPASRRIPTSAPPVPRLRPRLTPRENSSRLSTSAP